MRRLPFFKGTSSLTAVHSQDSVEHPAWLVRSIESQIIPRLLMHAVNLRRGDGSLMQRWCMTSEDVSEFANLLILHRAAIGVAYVQSWRDQGAPLPTLYLELLAPTASHLRHLRVQRQLGWMKLIRARYRLLRVVRSLRDSNAAANIAVATD